jgi:hypothetical protein
MSDTQNIYKIFYQDATKTNKILGYLSNVTQIIPNITSQNTTQPINLYDFTNTSLTNSYIYLTNAEYTQNIYAVGFWFSVNGYGLYTLLNVLSPNYKLTVSNKSLSDSANTFDIPLTNVYNMCALIFEGNYITKVIVNDNIYPLVNSIPIDNTNTIKFALGNDNTMTSKLNGYIGEIQILNSKSFMGGKFNIDGIYLKLKYKQTIPTTTLPPPVTTQPQPETTQSQPETTRQTITTETTQPPPETTRQTITTTETTQSQPETTQQIISPDVNGINIIPATTQQNITSTTTMYIPTTTMPPIQEKTGLLINLST